MTNSIVTVNVSQTVAPTPSTLQSSGAFVSQGGTTKAAGTLTLLTQLSDLTAILKAPAAITSLSWSTGVVTVTTSAPHGYPVGAAVEVKIAGATPVAYNGTFVSAVVDATTFTYPIASDPGTETVPGTYVAFSASELLAMATTFFGQGASQAVWVLELGPGGSSDGVTALATWIAANTGELYSYLVPTLWASEPTYLTFLAGFESTTAKTYFFTTMALNNYASFTPLMKCVVGLVPAPGTPSTEFSLASAFWVTLHLSPSATDKVTPTAFSFVFGVTPWPSPGNQATLAALKAAGVNYIGSGSEGGISNTILLWGTTMDGNDFTYWYSVDWVQIQIDEAISNAIINGSNNPINPLYYNQAGIDRLQAVATQVMENGVTFGLVLGNVKQTSLDGPALADDIDNGDFDGQTVVNAIPFLTYSKENPGDYKIGRYSGFAIVYTPARGFISIVFFVNVTQFVAQ